MKHGARAHNHVPIRLACVFPFCALTIQMPSPVAISLSVPIVSSICLHVCICNLIYHALVFRDPFCMGRGFGWPLSHPTDSAQQPSVHSAAPKRAQPAQPPDRPATPSGSTTHTQHCSAPLCIHPSIHPIHSLHPTRVHLRSIAGESGASRNREEEALPQTDQRCSSRDHDHPHTDGRTFATTYAHTHQRQHTTPHQPNHPSYAAAWLPCCPFAELRLGRLGVSPRRPPPASRSCAPTNRHRHSSCPRTDTTADTH